MAEDQFETLEFDGRAIALLRRDGASPGLVWLGGFRSDMRGAKAETLDNWAREHGRAFLRHDYSGHGQSGGDFRDGTISRWAAESLAVFERHATGRQILVGSSMGAWIALLMSAEMRRRGNERIAGLVLVAPAPDFTSDLIEPGLTARQRKALTALGFCEEKSDYSSEPDIYTRALIEDGRANRVLTGPIDTGCPVHILQGLDDRDVPYDHAMKLVEHLPADDVTLTLVPGGDHRLSRPDDLALLRRTVAAMLTSVSLMRFSVVASAIVAAVIGFGGTLALIIQAAQALGATQAETASWVTAMCLALALETAWLSWRTRMPIVTAWSTPGSALLAASVGFGMGDAVGAFLITAAMLIATGLFGPLTRLISRIPAPVAAAMLAGIIVNLVAAGFRTVTGDPWLILPLIGAFFVLRLFNPALSVLAVLIGGATAAFLTGRIGALPEPELSSVLLIAPEFSLAATVGLAVPLYLVTMASQNLSGLAVLRAAGYEPNPGQPILVTGIGSLLSAPFGALTTNLAAISAAICTGPDAHPDPSQRWLTGPFYALCYALFAAFGASLVALFAVLPPGLIALVAGLALMAPLGNALNLATRDEAARAAAVTAFAVTVSGLTVFGVGSAFWGLAAGLAVSGLERLRKA